MLFRKTALFILLFVFTSSIAQVMNVRKWRQSERDSLDNALLFYEENAYLLALPIFEEILNHHPNEQFLQYSYGKCALHRQDKHTDAWLYLSELYDKNKKAPDIQFDMALAAHYNYKFDEALKFVNMYASSRKTKADGKKNAAILKRYIQNAQYFYAMPSAAKLSVLNKNINSEDDESGPVVATDESVLLFNYTGKKSTGGIQNIALEQDAKGGYMTDLYQSVRRKDEFQAAVAMDSLNTNGSEQVVSLSNDGNILFMYRDIGDGHGDLYQCFKTAEGFSKPQKLKGLVNSYSAEGHCSLSPDGKTLYFSSDRTGGYGDKDIYKASLSDDSLWVNVKNLGDSINTPFDEDAPFMHADGVTLYFSSQGRTSMGGYDIFRAKMDLSDSTFKKAENLEYPINSTSDDRYFVVPAHGKHAYLSRGEKNGLGMSDIYKVENIGPRPALLLLKGRTTANGKPVAAQVKINVISRELAEFNTIQSDAVTGNYLVTLPPGADYLVTYTYKNLPRQTYQLNSRNLVNYTENSHDVKLREDTGKVTTPVVIAPVVTATMAGTAVTAKKDNFVPNNSMQSKTMRYIERYGNVAADSLEFRIQLAAMKSANRYIPADAKKLGRIEKIRLGDGFTRLTAGGSFKTLKKAFEHNKRVVRAGQPDAFVIVLYKGKRIQLEELEKMGIFK